MTDVVPVEPKPAATVILLRDGPEGPEVLMLEKAKGDHFAAGALVFPGGKVSDEDTRFGAGIPQNGDDPLIVHKLSAIREMYEECGILLARNSHTAGLVQKEADNKGLDMPFYELCQSLSCEPATDELVLFANWITPPTRSKRFDVQFFVAQAPDGHRSVGVDGWEIVNATWHRPGDLLREAERGAVVLVLATLMNLKLLEGAASVGDILRQAQIRRVIPVQPEWVETEDGKFARIPAEAGYGQTMIPTDRFRRA